MKRLTNKNFMLLAKILVEKIPDPCNAKKHSQSYIRKETTKSVKKSEIIRFQLNF